MPKPDSLTLHVFDLDNIMQSLETAHYGGEVVKIVDDGDRFIIRDPNDFQISSVKKTTNA